MRGGRRGSGLVESLVALLLTTGLLVLVGGLLVRYQRAARALAERVEGVETARLARDLVSLALAADPEARVEATGLAVRTFVGSGERCGEGRWRYRGRRLPDPRRDSLWIVTGAGRVRIAALTGLRRVECPAGSTDGMEWEADPPLPADARLVRIFESGRYRVDDALRYGRVGSGAQPLSAPVLDPRSSGIAGGEAAEVSVVPRGRSSGYGARWRP